MQNKNMSNILLFLGCLGMLGGVYGLYEAMIAGTGSTALNSATPWGLGVVTYLYFLGMSGGGLLIALLTLVLRKKQFENFSGIAAWTVLVTEICAGIAIASDLGHWERMYRVIISPNPASPMAWMFFFFAAMLLIYLAKVFALHSGNVQRAHMLTFWSIPVALLFYTTNGYIFGMISAEPLWSGAFIPLWFVFAALLSGGALVGALGWLYSFDDELMHDFGRVLLVLLISFAFFEVLYLCIAMQTGNAQGTQAVRNLLWGAGSVSFWLVHVVAGTLAPLFMLIGAKSSSRVGWAALVVLLTFIAARWNFVIPVQGVEPIEGLNSAFHHIRYASAYCPSLGEWLVTLFVSSLCLVALLIGPRLFPLLFSKQGERHV